jgi:hypothetical protein
MNDKITKDGVENTTDVIINNSSGKAQTIRPGLPPTMHDPSEVDLTTLEQTDPNALVRLNEYWSYDPRMHMVGLTSVLTGLDHEKAERQASAIAAEAYAGGWTVIIEYFATGEGTHVWYQRVYGGTKEGAIETFRSTFFANDSEEAWAFWSIGVTVHVGAFWPGYVKGYRTPPDTLEMHWQSQF